jgi:hypothetical protein
MARRPTIHLKLPEESVPFLAQRPNLSKEGVPFVDHPVQQLRLYRETLVCHSEIAVPVPNFHGSPRSCVWARRVQPSPESISPPGPQGAEGVGPMRVRPTSFGCLIIGNNTLLALD